MKKKVLIDVRRKLNSGIGRVTQWIVNHLTDFDSIEFYYFTFEENIIQYNLIESRCIVTKAKPLSIEEVYETPDLILKYNFDLYLNPQFNISPFITTKTITILHDFWYLKSEKALPTIDDVSIRLDLTEGNYFNVINNWLTDKNAEALMTNKGLIKYKQEKELKNDVLDLIWSQLSVFSFFSHSIVFITNDVKKDFEKVFKKKINSTVISNGYHHFFESVQSKTQEIFLCLAKLEERKNILLLLESYEIYYKKANNPVELVIAGDKGYNNYAVKVLSKIEEMTSKNIPVCFIDSANDSKIKELFEKTLALILISEYESFGLPTVEASLAEIPVITSNNGYAKDFLSNETIIIKNLNPEIVANALLEVQNNYPLYKEKAKQAKQIVIKTLNNEVLKAKWYNVISKAIYE
jgi:glycosyltransferase involved in cell wall biosynthesis